jgi:5'(3')-deoxyribonucleotidase
MYTKHIKKIWLDMDGVLADMDHEYHAMFGVTPQQARVVSNTAYRTYWNRFVEDSAFERLPLFTGAQKLVDFCNSSEVSDKAHVCILSSSSGIAYHSMVQQQKMNWLKKNSINFPACIVPGRQYKKGYADHQSFLVDDHPANIHDFISASGNGIIHTKDVDLTIEELRKFLEKE